MPTQPVRGKMILPCKILLDVCNILVVNTHIILEGAVPLVVNEWNADKEIPLAPLEIQDEIATC